MVQKTVIFPFVFLVVICALCRQAQAQTSHVYFAGYMGLQTYSDFGFSESTTATSGDLKIQNTPSFAGALGIRLSNHFRVEGELSYAKADMDSISFNNLGEFKLGGELTTWLALINVFYDFDVDWDVQPFVTAGVGFGRYDGKIDDVSGLAIDSSDDTTALTWQLGGGLKYRVSPDLAFTGGYRYIDSADLEFEGYDLDYGGHEFRIGLEYDFGAE